MTNNPGIYTKRHFVVIQSQLQSLNTVKAVKNPFCITNSPFCINRGARELDLLVLGMQK